jgi:hypothetical protein
LRTPLAAASAALLSLACATSAPPPSPPAAPPLAAPPRPDLAEVKPTGTPGQATAVRTQLLAAKVEAVDAASRTVQVLWQDGRKETITVGPKVKRLEELAPGDQVFVDVQQQLRLELQLPGSPSVPLTVIGDGGRTVPASTGAPGAVVSSGFQATVTVKRIDAATRVVALQDPAGASYEVWASTDVALEKLKVGDRLLATYTEATVLRVEKAAKQP